MPYYCTVPQCTSMSGKIKNVSFHQFPRDKELANLWNKILKRGKPYTKYSKVCSLHFKPEDFKGVWKSLRKDAIPSRNLPTVCPRMLMSSNEEENCEIIDSKMHQQLAAAIYSQSMLAMQATALMMNASKSDESSSSNDDGKSSNSFTSDRAHHGPKQLQVTEENIEFIKNILTNGHDIIEHMKQPTKTFTCSQCLKHYKDYDVYLLHKRTHNEENDTEKENIVTNQEVLKANPILANLLTSTQESIHEDNQDESLVANLKIYLNNLAAVMVQDSNVFKLKKDHDLKKGIDVKDDNIKKEIDIKGDIKKEIHTEGEITKEIDSEDEMKIEIDTEGDIRKEIDSENDMKIEIDTEDDVKIEISIEDDIKKKICDEDDNTKKQVDDENDTKKDSGYEIDLKVEIDENKICESNNLDH